MQEYQGNLFTREDTMFGVCEGLGQDFGFNPNWLRVTLAVALFFNPVVVAGGYLAAGVLVAFSRWVYPNPVQAVQPAVADAQAAPAPELVAAEEQVEAEPEQVPLAA